MKTLKQWIGQALLPLFLVTALWGVVLGVGMDHSMEGGVFLCPMMADHDVACGMGVTQHFALWKQLFSATLQSGWTLVLLVAFVRFFDKNQLRWAQEKRRFAAWVAPNERRERESLALMENPILCGLSQGTLAPKIYA